MRYLPRISRILISYIEEGWKIIWKIIRITLPTLFVFVITSCQLLPLDVVTRSTRITNASPSDTTYQTKEEMPSAHNESLGNLLTTTYKEPVYTTTTNLPTPSHTPSKTASLINALASTSTAIPYATATTSATATPSATAVPTTTTVPIATAVATATAATLAEAVQHFDTPEKLSAFLLKEITFTDHDGCLSYWPDVFYQKREGNCKDYSTFASYVLAQHGYNARRIVYTFYRDGIRLGHEVAAYEIGEETWIMSNGTISGPYTSLTDYFNSLTYLDYVTLLCIKPPGGVTCCNP